jgi:hypothetical protein
MKVKSSLKGKKFCLKYTSFIGTLGTSTGSSSFFEIFCFFAGGVS